MSLAWLLDDESVTSVLIGASSPKQIIENVKAIDSKEFTKEELDLIDKISMGK